MNMMENNMADKGNMGNQKEIEKEKMKNSMMVGLTAIVGFPHSPTEFKNMMEGFIQRGVFTKDDIVNNEKLKRKIILELARFIDTHKKGQTPTSLYKTHRDLWVEMGIFTEEELDGNDYIRDIALKELKYRKDDNEKYQKDKNDWINVGVLRQSDFEKNNGIGI